ncbi:MAG: beta-ketoacyl reductase, partial [Bryobacteraceae bacterium]
MNTPESDALLRRAGVHSLDARQALDAMGTLMQAGATQAVFAHIDWPRFRGSYEARGKRPLLARIDEGHTACGPLPHGRGPAGASLPEILRLVQEETAQVLQLGTALPESDHGFFEMGMDSLLALELRSRLEGSVRRSLPATLVFEYP